MFVNIKRITIQIIIANKQKGAYSLRYTTTTKTSYLICCTNYKFIQIKLQGTIELKANGMLLIHRIRMTYKQNVYILVVAVAGSAMEMNEFDGIFSVYSRKIPCS